MAIEPVQLAQDTKGLLSIAAAELHRLADEEPDIALELRRVAEQLKAEGAALV